MAGVDLYRDVPVNCFAVDDWNAVNVPPHEDFEEPEGEEIETGAGAFAFRHHPNRFLFWRIQGTQVDLVEHSLQSDLTENALSLHFSAPLIPSVRIIEEMQPAQGSHAQLSLFLLTQNNRLYRFHFRHPSTMPRQANRPERSIFRSKKIVSQHMEMVGGVASDSAIECFDCLDAHTVAIGSGNGSIYISTIVGKGELSELELRSSGMISKFWSSMTLGSREASQQAVNALTVGYLSNQSVVVTLCADRQIRVWSTLRNSLIQTIEVPTMEEGVPIRLALRSVSTSSDSFLVLARVDYETDDQSPPQSEFSLYTFQEGELLFLYSVSPPEVEVIDFALSESTLWVTGTHASGAYLTQRCRLFSGVGAASVSALGAWESIYSQHYHYLREDVVSPRSVDVGEAFLDRIFYPSRFPLALIREVLQELYPEAMAEDEAHDTVAGLRSAIYEVMHSDTPDEVEQFHQWKLLLECCEQKWKRQAYPLGLFVLSGAQLAGVIARDNSFLIRACSPTEEIRRAFLYNEFESKEQFYVDSLLDGSHPAGQYIKLFESAQCLISTFEAGQVGLLDRELFHTRDIGPAFAQCVQLVFSANQGSEAQSALNRVYQLFGQIDQPFVLLHHFLEACQALQRGSSAESASSITVSRFFRELLGVSFQQLAEANYTTLRNLTLLLFFLARSRQQLNATVQQSSEFYSTIIPQALQAVRQAMTMYWVSLCDYHPTSASSSASPKRLSLIQRYLPRQLPFSSSSDARGLDRMDEEEEEGDRFPFLTHQILPILEQVMGRWGAAAHQLTTKAPLANTDSDRMDMAGFLADSEQFVTLKQFLRLLHAQSAQVAFYMGRVHLHLLQFAKAADSFSQGAFHLHGEALFRYHKQVTAYFEAYQPNRQAAEFAVAAVQSCTEPEELPLLWSRVFQSALSLADYQLAYDAMLYSGEEQEHNLHVLISELCQAGRTDLLCYHEQFSFPWAGMVQSMAAGCPVRIPLVDAVDRYLQSQALQYDVLRQPNYYHILYAFHTFRGNYMKAGQAMIDCAQRLATCNLHDLSFSERLQRQMRCYLTALNVYRLIDEEYAWAEESYKTRDLAFPPASPKRMRDGDRGYQDVGSLPSSAPRVFCLVQELKRRYVIADAHLLLSQRDAMRSTQMMDATDTLSLLVAENLLDKAIILAKLTDQDTERYGLTLVFEKMTANILADTDERTRRLGWNQLQSTLAKYDTSANCEYYLVVAKKLLSSTSQSLPAWLLEALRPHVSACLRLLLLHCRFHEAADMVIQLLTNQQIVGPMPYTQIDQLLLRSEESSPELAPKLEQIQRLLEGEAFAVQEDAMEDAPPSQPIRPAALPSSVF